MSHADRWLGATLVLLALAWLWLVQTQIPDAGAEWPGPRGFPLLLGIVLTALSLTLVVAPGARNADRGSRIPDPGSRGMAGGTFGLLLLYAFLLERAGFLIATLIFVTITTAGPLRLRRWVFIASLAVALSLGCWLVFNSLLGIPLPRGVWVPW